MATEPDTSRVFAIVAAAGSGQRMGKGLVKVLRTLRNRAVLQYSIDPFLELEIPCVVMAPKDYFAEYQQLFADFASVSIVRGGETRSDSVRIGLKFISESFAPAQKDVVLVHDGARCLVSTQLIKRVIAAVFKHGAAIPALPASDTIKQVSAQGQVLATLDRSTLAAIQTPQGFHFELLKTAYDVGVDLLATDDAGLVEKVSPVFVVEGEDTNIKITRPIDLAIAEVILEKRATSLGKSDEC
jgi:2-C-methyl-D-erythritol 4-phosphate cytidylyltransferase